MSAGWMNNTHFIARQKIVHGCLERMPKSVREYLAQGFDDATKTMRHYTPRDYTDLLSWDFFDFRCNLEGLKELGFNDARWEKRKDSFLMEVTGDNKLIINKNGFFSACQNKDFGTNDPFLLLQLWEMHLLPHEQYHAIIHNGNLSELGCVELFSPEIKNETQFIDSLLEESICLFKKHHYGNSAEKTEIEKKLLALPNHLVVMLYKNLNELHAHMFEFAQSPPSKIMHDCNWAFDKYMRDFDQLMTIFETV